MLITLQQPPARHGIRLGALIVASIALHGVLLAAWNQSSSPTPSSTPLTVTLLATPPQALPPENHPQQNRSSATTGVTQQSVQKIAQTSVQIVKEATPTIVASDNSEPPAALEQAMPAIEPHQIATSEPASQHNDAATTKTRAEVTTMMRASLNRDINHYFKYPRLASSRNWEGTVLLDLQIENDGRISRITLAQSSGYALLDNNAIATLTRIGTLSGTTQWLERGNIELQIPVIYRITDS